MCLASGSLRVKEVGSKYRDFSSASLVEQMSFDQVLGSTPLEREFLAQATDIAKSLSFPVVVLGGILMVASVRKAVGLGFWVSSGMLSDVQWAVAGGAATAMFYSTDSSQPLC
jgi:hypothetical protein